MRIIRRPRARPAGWTQGDGTRKPGAPVNWPFGTLPPPTRAQPRVRRALAPSPFPPEEPAVGFDARREPDALF